MVVLLLAGEKSGLGGENLSAARENPATAHAAATASAASRGKEYLVGRQRREERGPGLRLDRALAVDGDAAVAGRHETRLGYEQHGNQQQGEYQKYDNRSGNGEVARCEYESGHNGTFFTI